MDLVTFTEEILKEKLQFYCSERDVRQQLNTLRLPFIANTAKKEKTKKKTKTKNKNKNKISFPLRISSVNLTKSAVFCKFSHVY